VLSRVCGGWEYPSSGIGMVWKSMGQCACRCIAVCTVGGRVWTLILLY
jgi:hypothetical protein